MLTCGQIGHTQRRIYGFVPKTSPDRGELEDEFDYVLALLEKVEGMNAATRQRAEALMAKIGGIEKRKSDSEMSVEDKVQIAQIIAREIAKHY